MLIDKQYATGAQETKDSKTINKKISYQEKKKKIGVDP